jgi:DNA helicase-2/ATP-dependent DNA helicase PcrA
VDRLKAYAADAGVRLYEAVRKASEIGAVKRALVRLQSFVELIDSLSPLVEESPRLALEQTLSLTGLRAQLEQQREHDTDAADNVDELISAAEEYSKTNPEAALIDWLSYTSLLGDVDMIDGDTGSVTLMTLHAAKGLEFSVVYMVGVEDGLLPLVRGDQGVEDLEEERRLCFVGMTRAKKRLTLSLARWRMLRGVTRKTIRSRFLDELPDDELEWAGGAAVSPTLGGGKPPGELPDDVHLWEVGTLVRHPAHGIGQVTAMYRGARRTHVNVLFRDGHDGSWVLEFADLTRVDYDEAGEMT